MSADKDLLKCLNESVEGNIPVIDDEVSGIYTAEYNYDESKKKFRILVRIDISDFDGFDLTDDSSEWNDFAADNIERSKNVFDILMQIFGMDKHLTTEEDMQDHLVRDFFKFSKCQHIVAFDYDIEDEEKVEEIKEKLENAGFEFNNDVNFNEDFKY